MSVPKTKAENGFDWYIKSIKLKVMPTFPVKLFCCIMSLLKIHTVMYALVDTDIAKSNSREKSNIKTGIKIPM